MLPQNACYYFCKADVPRAMDENLLWEMGQSLGLPGKPYPSVRNAIEAARKLADPDDLIFIGGSTFIVAEAIYYQETCHKTPGRSEESRERKVFVIKV